MNSASLLAAICFLLEASWAFLSSQFWTFTFWECFLAWLATAVVPSRRISQPQALWNELSPSKFQRDRVAKPQKSKFCQKSDQPIQFEMRKMKKMNQPSLEKKKKQMKQKEQGQRRKVLIVEQKRQKRRKQKKLTKLERRRSRCFFFNIHYCELTAALLGYRGKTLLFFRGIPYKFFSNRYGTNHPMIFQGFCWVFQNTKIPEIFVLN